MKKIVLADNGRFYYHHESDNQDGKWRSVWISPLGSDIRFIKRILVHDREIEVENE